MWTCGLNAKKKSWTLIMELSNRLTRQRQRKPSRKKQGTRKRKRATKLNFNRLISLLLLIAFYSPAWDLSTIWAPFTAKAPPTQAIKETPRTRKNVVFMRVSGVFQSLNRPEIILCKRELFYYFLVSCDLFFSSVLFVFLRIDCMHYQSVCRILSRISFFVFHIIPCISSMFVLE